MRTVVCCSLVLLCVQLASRSFSYIHTYPAVERAENDTTKPLFIAFITSFGGGYNSSHSIPWVQLALDRINQDPSILPGYTLHYTLTDSQCNHSVGLSGFFQQIVPGPTKVAMIGAGCSVATEPVADISHFYNITHVACSSSSASLANRVRFKSYFQLLPSEDRLAPAFVALSLEYRWRRITIIQQDENLFSVLTDQILELFNQVNISWNLYKFVSSKGVLSLSDNKIFNPNNRITYLAMYSNHAKQYICEAFKRGLRYPQYVYLLYGWYRHQWWHISSDNDNVTCTRSQMEQVLERSILVTQYPEILNRSQVTDTGENYNTFRKVIDKKLEETGYEFTYVSEDCYDATWVLAQALNKTITDLNTNTTLKMMAAAAEQANNTEFKLELFTYKNNIVKNIMFRHLENTDFTGITGHVTFDQLGIRTVNQLRISQYQRINETLHRVEIALVFRGEKGFQYNDGKNISSVWPGAVIPYDGVAKNLMVSVSIVVTVPYSCISTVFGITFAVICLLFNIIFRNRKIIRLSSPSLNYIIIAGALIMYVSIILYANPVVNKTLTTVLCNLRSGLVSVGYCLCFGTILVKMWRVYVIFTGPKPNQTVIRDWHLGMFVTALVVVDLILLGVVLTLPFARDLATLVPNEEHPFDEEGELRHRTNFFVYICNQQSNYTRDGVVFGYIALLQIAAIFLAFGTRKVKVKGLNDSLYIATTIYITSILLVVTIAALLFLNNRVNTYATLLSTTIFISATVILSLVFIPKMIWLYKDPKGLTIFNTIAFHSNHGQQQTTQFTTISSADRILSDQGTSDKEKMSMLVARVKELEMQGNGKSQEVQPVQGPARLSQACEFVK